MMHDILLEFFFHKIKVRNFIILRSFSDPTIGHHSVGHVTGHFVISYILKGQDIYRYKRTLFQNVRRKKVIE